MRSGETYQVTEGAGLDRGRIGMVQSHRNLYQQFFRDIEPGRCDDFDSRKEALLVDKTGRYFTMFKRYLSPVIDPGLEKRSYG